MHTLEMSIKELIASGTITMEAAQYFLNERVLE